MTKEALKLALEALECALSDDKPYIVQCKEAITAIKEALAQPEQDGKCKYCTDGCPACDARKLPEQKSVAMADYMALTEKYVALKATQPEQEQFALKHRIAELEGALIGLQAQRTWVGLTDGEIEVIEALKAPPVHPDFIDCDDWMDFARTIEYKLKEKNELR